MVAVNWGEAVGGNFEPLEAADVAAPLEATLSGFEAKTGPKGVYFSCEYTLDGEAAEKHGNRKFWDNCSTASGGLWHTKEVLLALGISADRMSAESSELPEDLLAESVGQAVRLKVTPPQKYPKNDGTEGVRNSIDKVLPSAYAMP